MISGIMPMKTYTMDIHHCLESLYIYRLGADDSFWLINYQDGMTSTNLMVIGIHEHTLFHKQLINSFICLVFALYYIAI